ncbi:MAG: YegS/Rv2252/BmrU family lipid kinase [Chloroherpetonaceae bacterium]|nr:YegS/Rv2252/BmrU family lipid kinase [Chloroherpetonaceae bacterium]
MKKRIPFIVNPTANGGHSIGKIQKLSENEEVELFPTKNVGDATTLMKEISQKSEGIMLVGVAGGDGTISEAIQKWEVNNLTTGILLMPIGSGNDFAKNFHQKESIHTRIDPEKLINGKHCDLGEAKFFVNGKSHDRRFINSMGIGLTGEIAFYANQAKLYLRGELIYVYALLKTVWKHQSQEMQILLTTKEGETVLIKEKVYAICIGNGHTEGGKFRIAPEAKIDDGVVDVSILLHFPLWKLPLWIIRFLKGTHLFHKGLHYHQVKSVKVMSSAKHRIHFDGEVINEVENEIEVSVLEKKVKICGVLKMEEGR